MQKFSLRAFFIAITVISSIALSTVAHADEQTPTTPLQILNKFSSFTQTPAATLLEDLVNSSKALKFQEPSGSDSTGTVTSNASSLVALRDGSLISVALPFGSPLIRATHFLDSAISFDNRNGSFTALLPKNHGNLQAAILILRSSAPEDYSFAMKLPIGVHASMLNTGAVMFVGPNDQYLGGIAPAWALDSNGQNVPTRFSLRDSTLIQTVEHKSAQFAYPIVADPWFGIDLIDHTSWVSGSSLGPTLQVFPTSWGRTVGFATTYPLGGAVPIFGGALSALDSLSVNAAWSETLDKTTKVGHPNPNTQSMFAQFECHFFYVSKKEPSKQSWNLDTNRPNAVLWNQVINRCNVN